MINKIAIQGIRGSFHELAVQKYFEADFEAVECDTFKGLFDTLRNKEADYAVMAIENTVAGTILPNYAMLRDSKLTIIGEVYLRIQQNLMAMPGVKIEDITAVFSHPMAIMQCLDFFENYPQIRLVESLDTAASARDISVKKDKYAGAIASEIAADIYKLNILAAGIETNKKNFTRFLVLQDENNVAKGGADLINKASLCFNVKNEKGALAGVLTKIADQNINLIKIQSLPLVGQEWEYFIHIDTEFEKYENYLQAVKAILPDVNNFKELGKYQRGLKYN
jgi:prephenate dehydratase